MYNFISIGSGVLDPRGVEFPNLPLTVWMALTTVFALTCYTVMMTVIFALEYMNETFSLHFKLHCFHRYPNSGRRMLVCLLCKFPAERLNHYWIICGDLIWLPYYLIFRISQTINLIKLWCKIWFQNCASLLKHGCLCRYAGHVWQIIYCKK